MNVKKLVTAGICTAAGILLPSVFHTIHAAGTVFLPMHIPVLLCGLICGYRYGGICGILVPLLCSVLTGKPPLYPTGIAMMIELCAYGVITGLMSKRFHTVISLITAMIGGRIINGIVCTVLYAAAGNAYSWKLFFSGSFIMAFPGIVIQIILIPILVLLLQKAHVLESNTGGTLHG